MLESPSAEVTVSGTPVKERLRSELSNYVYSLFYKAGFDKYSRVPLFFMFMAELWSLMWKVPQLGHIHERSLNESLLSPVSINPHT